MNPQHRHPDATHNATTQVLQGAADAKGSMHKGPSHEEIARRAYALYEKTGCAEGRCQQNWQQAEHELVASRHATRDAKEAMANEGGTAPAPVAIASCECNDSEPQQPVRSTHGGGAEVRR